MLLNQHCRAARMRHSCKCPLKRYFIIGSLIYLCLCALKLYAMIEGYTFNWRVFGSARGAICFSILSHAFHLGDLLLPLVGCKTDGNTLRICSFATSDCRMYSADLKKAGVLTISSALSCQEITQGRLVTSYKRVSWNSSSKRYLSAISAIWTCFILSHPSVATLADRFCTP